MKSILTYASLALILILTTIDANAQHLTISTTGDTGTSGTNWSISGNTLNVAASGSANVHPNVITNHLTNVGDLTVVLPWLSMTSRDLYINASIAYTGASARTLTFKIVNDIIVQSGTSITSSNAAMNLVLRTALSTSNTDHGRIQLDGVTINTNGGHLWAGGGSGDVTWNGLTVGDDQARAWVDDVAAISFKTSTLTTSGGNVFMKGMSFNTSDGDGQNYGVELRNCNITSNAGQVDLTGGILGAYSQGGGLAIFADLGPVNISTTSGAINLTGSGTDNSSTNSGWRRATILYTNTSSKISISSVSGNIAVSGTATFNNSTGTDDIIGTQFGSTTAVADGVKITSQTGNISISGSTTRENAGRNANAVQFIAANIVNSIRIGYDGTNAYSGNITIEGNSIIQNNINGGSGSISIKSTGALTIQPKDNAFTYLRAGSGSDSITFDNDWDFGSSFSSFTFGKSTNTLPLNYTSPLNVAGPVTFHTGAFTINEDITASIAANIAINAKGNFNTDNVSRQTITSNGGNVSIIADSDANGTGVLDLDRLTINPGSGNILIRGKSFSWAVDQASVIPILNGSGSLTLEPSDSSFGQGLDLTGWIKMNDDGSKFSAITLGKNTNNGAVAFGVNPNGVATGSVITNGPISLYGGDISISQNVNTTGGGASGDVLLKASGKIYVANAKTITTSGGDATLWADSDGNGTGYVQVSSTVTITTGGGDITMGGGVTITTGYARGDATLDAEIHPGMTISGVHLKDGVSLSSGGGNITLRGQNLGGSTNTVQCGILGHNVTVDAGGGKVNMVGKAGGSGSANAQAISAHGNGWTIRSSNAGADAIVLDGDGSAYNGSVTSMGINYNGTIESTGGGGVQITGKSGTATGYDHPVDIYGSVLSSSGNITITAQNNAAAETGLYLTTGSTLGFKSGTNVTSSTSNIILKSDNTVFNVTTTVNTNGTVSILPLDASTSFGVAQTIGSSLALSAGVSGLTVGKSGNTANITMSTPQTIAGPITLYGGSLALNGALTATNNTINLHATGSVTQTSAITANGLGLHGAGTFTLTNTGNNVATIAGGDNTTRLGSVSYVDASGGLTIGMVNPSGITASGPVLIETLTGDITVSNSVTTTDTTSDAIIINAGKSSAIGTSSGGDIKISGSPTIMTGSGGIAKLFSGSEPASTGLTSLAGGSSNVRYLADETSTSYSPSLQSNNVYAIYRVANLPDAPTSLVATPCGGQAAISFVAGADNGSPITNYQYSLDGTTWTTFSPSVTGTTVTITALTSGTYNISLRAVNSAGAGAASTSVTCTINTNVTISYTGVTIAIASNKSAQITLSATVTLPAGADVSQQAQVRFINRDTGQPISGWLAVTGTSNTGTVSHTAALTLGTHEIYRKYNIGFEVGGTGCFNRNSAADNVTVTVAEPSCGCY